MPSPPDKKTQCGQLDVAGMAPMKAMRAMKAMKAMRAMKSRGGPAMTKGALAEALAADADLKKPICGKILDCLAEIGAKEVKGTGIFTIPGLCRIKTRRMMFGKEVKVAAKPAKTVVKAFAVAALKQQI